MNKKKFTKLLALYLPYLVIGLAATNLGEAWRLAEGKELGDKIVSLMGTLPAAFANPLPSLHPLDILVGICCGAGLRLAVYLKSKNAKKYRHGMEYGSARWGTPADIAPFIAPKFEDNIILTKTERLMMSNRPPDPKNARNKNVLVVGGSGSGKTRYFIKPNLLQCTSKSHPVSFVVTDPKGGLIQECGLALLKNGYKIRTMNTINFHKSMRYNPFAYIHEEKDILKLVTTLMTNTKGEGQGGDPFWDKAERLLLTSLIAYLHYEAPAEEQNFATLLEMLNTMQVSEEDEDYQNPVDLLFEDLAKKKPNSFAGRQYKLYKLAAGKTAKSILISCGARLSPFDIQEIRDATMYDELELDKLGDRKTALFLIMSDTDSTFNFLISMIYSQLFNLLCDKADDVYGGKLPVHVRCLIDECANIGQIPQLEKLVATIRSREISACLVLQTRSQLKAIYKDNADTIVGNMDSQIFLGGSEPTTLKDLAEALGKETIDSYNNSDTRGNSPSYGTNYQKLGHELMSRDELAVLDGGKCILQLRGVRPFLSDKYDLTQHPNYKLTSDANPKNALDIEKYLTVHVAHDGIRIILVDGFQLAAGLQNQTRRDLTAADSGYQLFQLRNLTNVGTFVDKTPHMDRQLTAVLVICLIAEQIEKLRVDHGDQEVKGAVCIAHDEKQRRFSVAQLVQFQLIVHGGIPDFLNVEGCHPGTAGNKDRLGRFAGSQLIKFVLPHCKGFWLLLAQILKQQVYRILISFIVLRHLHSIQHFQQCCEVLLLNRGFVVEVRDQ